MPNRLTSTGRDSSVDDMSTTSGASDTSGTLMELDTKHSLVRRVVQIGGVARDLPRAGIGNGGEIGRLAGRSDVDS